MPLEPPDQKFFEAACGYAQLGMFLDANEELEKVDPYKRAAPEILALRVAIYRGLEKWELMAAISKRLVEFELTMSSGRFRLRMRSAAQIQFKLLKTSC
jgi:hypothetical protein